MHIPIITLFSCSIHIENKAVTFWKLGEGPIVTLIYTCALVASENLLCLLSKYWK